MGSRSLKLRCGPSVSWCVCGSTRRSRFAAQSPIVVGGSVAVDVPLRNKKGRKLRDTERTFVELDRIQLEIDSGKSHHTMHRDYTLVDLNRCVVALALSLCPQGSPGYVLRSCLPRLRMHAMVENPPGRVWHCWR